MKKTLEILGTLFIVIAIGVGSWYGGLFDRWLSNRYEFKINKIDEKTYENQKKVEDTARAMISSYEADKLTYEQYKDSESELEKSWSNEAKMRANRTASKYNNYILENSFVWKDNVPNDIKNELELLK